MNAPSPARWCLRAVGPGHRAVLAALHARAFVGGEVWDEAAIGGLLDMPGTVALLAAGAVGATEDASGPAGFLLLRCVCDEAEILTLAVDPVCRRQGVGSALVAAALARARTEGSARVFLEVAVRNDTAQALYARCGFERCGLRRGYYADGGDALVLAAVPGDLRTDSL